MNLGAIIKPCCAWYLGFLLQQNQQKNEKETKRSKVAKYMEYVAYPVLMMLINALVI